MKVKVTKFVKEFNDLINKLNKVKNSIETFYKINEKIINDFDFRNRNFQIIKNLQNFQKNFTNNIFLEDINQLLIETNYDKKI